MDELEKPYIEYEEDAVTSKYWCDPNKLGKWMLFFKHNVLNNKWRAAVALYRTGQLKGILRMRCSTGVADSRVLKKNDGVIMFACGPCYDEETVLIYGQNLVEKMGYCDEMGRVTYKTDNQSAMGTRSDGIKRNYCYQIPVPLDEDPDKA